LGTFDVEVNGELVFSKRKTGTFPDEVSLVKQLVSTYKN